MLKTIIKRVGVLLLGLTFFISLNILGGSAAKANGSLTHPWLTKNGIRIVADASPEVAKLLYAPVNWRVPAAILISNANSPDFTISELFPVGQEPGYNNYAAPHYYDVRPGSPTFGKNIVGTEDTANSRLQYHYNRAVELYRAGNKATAYLELSMALHYIEDISTPHHVVNANSSATNHGEYETWIDLNAPFTASFNQGAITLDTAGSFKDSPIWDIGHKTALDSLEMAKLVVAPADTDVTTKNYDAIVADLKDTQITVAEVIYKFYHDVEPNKVK